MKKILVSVILAATALHAFAGEKVRIGLKLAPALSYANVKDSYNDGYSISRSGTGFRGLIGPYFDFMINDNASFGLGIWYSPRTVMLKMRYANPLGTFNPSSQYNLQYLMIPVYFKFYTNEITPKLKVYFTVGGTADFKIAEKVIGNDDLTFKMQADLQDRAIFSYFDASVMIGTGIEYKLGDITTFTAGIGYNRGLLNIINPFLNYDRPGSNGSAKLKNDLVIKNNLLSLDLGIKF